MSEESMSQEKPVVTTTSDSILSSKLLIYALILLVGILIGYFSYSMLPFGKSTVVSTPQSLNTTPSNPSQPSITEDKSPVSISLLTNPIVYEWRGSITGKLTTVNPDSYVIKDDKGNSITLFYKTPSMDPWKTVFLQSDGKEWKDTTLGAISIGSTLRGDFFIFKDSPNTPVGNSFQVVK